MKKMEFILSCKKNVSETLFY